MTQRLPIKNWLTYSHSVVRHSIWSWWYSDWSLLTIPEIKTLLLQALELNNVFYNPNLFRSLTICLCRRGELADWTGIDHHLESKCQHIADRLGERGDREEATHLSNIKLRLWKSVDKSTMSLLGPLWRRYCAYQRLLSSLAPPSLGCRTR